MDESGRATRDGSGRLAAVAGVVLVLAAAGPAVPAQPVQGDIVSVGFQARVSTGHVVREGQWFPILVTLSGQGTQSYDVELRCERADLDGDRVAYVEPHVVVTPEAGLRRVWCYAVTLKENAGEPLTIDIIGDDGVRIGTMTAPLFEPIGNDTQLILDISSKRVTWLDNVNSPAEEYLGFAWGQRTFYRSICVATLPARDLPDRWIGLEAVDVIVWDEPEPETLSIAQLAALVDWVRNGGQLVVGIGPAGTKIQKSVLAEIMPLELTQPPVEVRELGAFQHRYMSTDERFDAPISVAVGAPTRGALVTFGDQLPDKRAIPLIALRCVGSGRVIATTPRLHDLGRVGLRREFYTELLDLNLNEADFKAKEAEQYLARGALSLYQPLIAQIEFRRLASARILAAFAFVAAYILLATFGVWSWLKRHSLTHLSWVAFAVFAGVASLLSLGAVGLSHGVTGTVHNYSFVDLDSGSSEARVTTYFGYKSNRRQLVDLSLPAEGGYLRPLSSGPDTAPLYTTPERYAAVVGKATLTDTPMRATLKQFEGVWRGQIEGGIRGSLTADRDSGKITPQSWIQNDLDVHFTRGYVLYIDPRMRGPDGDVPYRAAGLDRRADRKAYYGTEKVPPAVNFLALAIPPLKPGERVDGLGTNADEDAYNEYGRYDGEHGRWQNRPQPDPTAEPMLPTLRDCQLGDWMGPFGLSLRPFATELPQADAAALLASTRNLHLHNSDSKKFDTVGRPLSTVGLPDQDITHWLTRGQAVLLLLSDQPGPVKLQIGGDPRRAKEGRSIYRVRIPISYVGRPPRGTAE
jgi:hypothetical protein